MYSDSVTDGSQFGGGGFIATQGGGLNNDSSFSPGGSTKRAGSQNSGLLPLTVKQLSMAAQKPNDDNFYVDGQEVNNITLVGMVNGKEEKATDVSFQLDDFTGKIEVKKWIDGQDSAELSELRTIRNDSYVRIHGHLRSFQGKRNVVAFSVRPIEDFNEVTFHFLECIFVHLSNTKGGVIAPRTPGSYGMYNAPTSQAVPTKNSYNQYSAPATTVTTGMPAGMSADDIPKRVQAIFDDPSSLKIEQGLRVEQVAAKLAGVSTKQVEEAIEFLVNEGLIYSSIDELHYKSASI